MPMSRANLIVIRRHMIESELLEHSKICDLCWSISEASTVHRLARLG